MAARPSAKAARALTIAATALLLAGASAAASREGEDVVEVRPDDPWLRGGVSVPAWVPPTLGATAGVGGIAYLVRRARKRR